MSDEFLALQIVTDARLLECLFGSWHTLGAGRSQFVGPYNFEGEICVSFGDVCLPNNHTLNRDTPERITIIWCDDLHIGWIFEVGVDGFPEPNRFPVEFGYPVVV